MKPKTISYSKSIESRDEVGLKSWIKAGVEIELEDSSVEKGFEEARQMVGKALNVTVNPEYAHLLNGTSSYPPPIINLQKEKTEIAIDNCTSIEELNKIVDASFKNGLVNEFLNKKKQLQ